MKAKSHRHNKRAAKIAKPLDPHRRLRSERLETYSPLTLPQWAAALGVELRLEERAMEPWEIKIGLTRYYTYVVVLQVLKYEEGDTTVPAIAYGAVGNGDTPREALADLAKQLQLQKVQLRDGTEFVVPLLKA